MVLFLYMYCREISYYDFHNYLLPSGNVDKIIVTNKTTARYIIALVEVDLTPSSEFT